MKLDKQTQKRIISFLEEKLEGAINPGMEGKALKGNGTELWRYRVGDYRLICQINDMIVTVLVVSIGHRKEIYHRLNNQSKSLAITRRATRRIYKKNERA